MRKEDLQQYRDLQKEIQFLKQKLNKLNQEVVTDHVVSSNRAFPYQKVKVEITGLPHKTYIKSLQRTTRARIERCRSSRHEIEEFISSIEDSRTRMVFEHRYIDGWSWIKISRSMGSGDESYARKIHDRHLRSL